MSTALNSADLRRVVLRQPAAVQTLLREHTSLMVGGGFIRNVVVGARPSDLDIFGCKADVLKTAAKRLVKEWSGRLVTTDNALTVLAQGRVPVQFITRWTFTGPSTMLEAFDFTTAQAAVFWRNGWASLVGPLFYEDLAARRLTYTRPTTAPELGASMLRVVKFLRRGWSIAPEELAAIMAALPARESEIITALREVDPLDLVTGIAAHEEVAF